MSVCEKLLLCELCLTNSVSKEPIIVHPFLSDFYNFLQQLFENFNIDVPVNEIQARMCPKCAAKILTMFEDLESWRAAQSKRSSLPSQEVFESVVVKMEPIESEEESMDDPQPFYDDIELTDVKLESNDDKKDHIKTDDENLLILPHSLPGNSDTSGIHRLQSSVVCNVRRYNCNHPGCAASFAYKRAYMTHINKCHYTLMACRAIHKTCPTHGSSTTRKLRGGVRSHHYNDSGQGNFIPVEGHESPKKKAKPKPKPKPKLEVKRKNRKAKKTSQGQFIDLNTVKTLKKPSLINSLINPNK